MSLIHTCQLCGANPFNYLTQLQQHGEVLSRNPERWMPWNYRTPDYAKVHALQDKFSLIPLSYYGKPYTSLPGEVDAHFDMKTAVRDQVDALSITEYFDYLAKLMKTNPPAAADAPMLAKMAAIGLVPGQNCDPAKLGFFDSEIVRLAPIKYHII